MTKEQSTISIRRMEQEDYPRVSEILQAGMDTGEATYERDAPADWDSFISHRVRELAFVAEEQGVILGWITATPTSHRGVFDGVVEDSIYVSPDAAGKGVAGKLLDVLLDKAGERGFWSMHSSIFLENEGSVALHESRGFTPVGVFHCMAKMSYGPKEGQWRDNLLMERILEKGPAWESFSQTEAYKNSNSYKED